MLYKNSVIPETLFLIEELMDEPMLQDFRLVGGTALSLFCGHRISDDIDLFTDVQDIEIKSLKKRLIQKYEKKISISELPFGISMYYRYNILGDEIKIDIMNYETEQFLKPVVLIENIRFACLEDIAAMKLNAVTGRKNKKDFIDISELLKHFSLGQMIGYFEQRFIYYDKKDVLLALSSIDLADVTPMPRMMKVINWDNIKNQIKTEVRKYLINDLK